MATKTSRQLKPVPRKTRRRPAVKSKSRVRPKQATKSCRPSAPRGIHTSKPKSKLKPTPSLTARPVSKPLGGSPAVIAKGSIEHVVIILKENHTFDSYFGTFPGANGDSTLSHASNPPIGTFSNNHAAWLARATKAVREQYQQADIGSYWSYAQQFTLCDNFFTDVA